MGRGTFAKVSPAVLQAQKRMLVGLDGAELSELQRLMAKAIAAENEQSAVEKLLTLFVDVYFLENVIEADIEILPNGRRLSLFLFAQFVEAASKISSSAVFRQLFI